MRVRTAAPLAVAVVLTGAAVEANAAPPKPITKTYQVQGVPHPVPPTGPSCSSSPAGVSEVRETIKVSGPGKLVVEVTKFTGDWDIGLYGGSGETMLAQGGGADAGNTDTAPKETLTYKSKKAQTLFLDVCNFAGTPTAEVKYTYTYS